MKKDNSKYNKLVEEIEDNMTVAKEILKLNGNNKTKVVLDNDINNNYYIFLNDTIYITNKKNKMSEYNRFCVIAHEIVHSMQSKKLQLMNFLLSNLEIIIFITTVILYFFNVNIKIISIIYILILILNVVIRNILEIDAIKRAINFSEKYFKTKLSKENTKIITDKYREDTKKYLPFFILNLYVFKIIRVVIIGILLFNYIY